MILSVTVYLYNIVKHREVVSKDNLKLFNTDCMLIISLMDSWVIFWCPIVWVFTCWINENLCCMSYDFRKICFDWELEQAMLKCGMMDKPLFECYFVWVFVSFCINFLDRTHIWTLVLYCRSTTAQLCERVANCMILWKFEDSTLNHGRDTFTMVVVISTTTIIW